LDAVGTNDVVLDIGGWADPLWRADWVMDLAPYETRGLYERNGWVAPHDLSKERFGPETWITRDICDREPYPFDDKSIDFVVCSHTLEDIRDPVWVCSEMQRIAKAGYIEVPSRLEEQTWGIHGDFVGWVHHRWLIDIDRDAMEFVFKLHAIHANPRFYFPASFAGRLSDDDRVQSLWWKGSFDVSERVMFEEEEATNVYLGEFVSAQLAARGLRPEPAPRSTLRRARSAGKRLTRLLHRAAR